MNFPYTYGDLKSDLNSEIQNRIDMLVDASSTIKRAVDEVFSEVDLASAKRRVRMSPGIFEDVTTAVAPADMKSDKVVDVIADTDKRRDRDWAMTTPQRMRNNPHKELDAYDADSLLAVDRFNGERRIMLSTLDLLEKKTVISTLDSVSENNGSWSATGDGENLQKHEFAYKKGSGSLSVDVNSNGGGSFGIEHTSLEPITLEDDYFDDVGSIFTYVYLPQTNNVNSFLLRVGSSNNDYHEMTTSSPHDNTSLKTGWNLLRFDLDSATTVGSVDNSDIKYVKIRVDKDSSLQDVEGFKFDHIVLNIEDPHEIEYYTNYPWVDSNGDYKTETSKSQDKLVADKAEYKLVRRKALEIAFQEAQEDQRSQNQGERYMREVESYEADHPSESLVKITKYQSFDNPSPGNQHSTYGY